MRFSR